MGTINIVEYKSWHQPYFEKLNRAWIERYFLMEERDIAVLTRPEQELIEAGGAVIIAEYNGIVAGVAGLKKVDNVTYEFTKMAVDENYRRRGIAEHICYAAFQKAKELGAETVILYSNSELKAALAMYEKIGFHHVAVDNIFYKRSDVKMSISMEDAMRSVEKFYSMANA
jgi:ribosomal protein S18 acetylase RimI-like enzyme